jgi:hypothetical protein
MSIPMNGYGVEFAKAHRVEQIAAAEHSRIRAQCRKPWGARVNAARISIAAQWARQRRAFAKSRLMATTGQSRL